MAKILYHRTWDIIRHCSYIIIYNITYPNLHTVNCYYCSNEIIVNQVLKQHVVYFIQDFIAIGIDKRGFQLKLENEVKKLPTPELSSSVPVS